MILREPSHLSHAATYELLVLLRQFDARAGWTNGFVSCAHWLHWRTGIDLGAAREKVRVAHALVTLPRISAAMQRGELSYAKVRALTRVATPENEPQLLDVARAVTAAQVERLMRAWRRVDRLEAAEHTDRRHHDRQLVTWVDDDGMLVIRGRLTPEAGAVLRRALEAAEDRLRREAAPLSAADHVVDETTSAQRRADALVRVAESALAADLDGGTAGDRYQVVIHVDEPALRSDIDTGQAVVEDSDGVYVSAETAQRLACDASTVMMRHGADGTVLDVGRRTRTVPAAIRRALATRDRSCQFPGCTARRCEAHHIQHWADGGPTRLENLLLLCKRHHRAVHEEGFRVARRNGMATFFRPNGTRPELAPKLPPAKSDGLIERSIVSSIPLPDCDSERFDVVWAIDVLRGRRGDRPTAHQSG